MNRDQNGVAVAWICGAIAASVAAIALLAGCGGSSSSSHDFCTDQASVQKQFRGVFSNLNPPSKDQYTSLAAELHTLENEAPDPAKTYLATMAVGADKAAGSGSGFLDDPAVVSAASELNTYVNAHCS